MGPAASGDREGLARYYATVAPFYDAEMSLRDDIPQWLRIATATRARTVLDLGCGGGRVARALAEKARVVGVDLLAELRLDRGFAFVRADVRALPFGPSTFDLAIAANDPFAHLLEDADRIRALDEACLAARRLVIDGLAIPPADDALARAGGLVREARLPDGTIRHETWIALGHGRYRTTYRYRRAGAIVGEASTTVRAWEADETALQGRDLTIAGALDGRPWDQEAGGFVIAIGPVPWAVL
jgi:SAM-dependent methyltransferase